MSAFLISLAHVDALIAYGALATAEPRHLSPIVLTVPGDCGLSADGEPVTIDFSDAATRDDIGRILFTANGESLAARYGAGDSQSELGLALGELYTFKPSTGTTEPAAIIGACDCFDYQACEAESYQMSLAQWLVSAIRNKAAGELRTGWEISDDTRDSELDSIVAGYVPAEAPADTGAPVPEARAAMLARLVADTLPAIPDAPEPAAPAPEPEAAAPAPKGRRKAATAPKPEPELTRAKAAKAKAAGGKNTSAKAGKSSPAKAKRNPGAKAKA